MKRITIVLTILVLTISCKESKKENSSQPQISVETLDHHGHDGATHELDDTWVSEIVLDKGAKWRANKETTENVLAMLTLTTQNRASTIEDYKKLGDNLNEDKNILIKECTMEGASDDNLHVWLHPLIEKIGLLQKTESVEDGEKLTANIENHLEGYYDYFD